MNSLQPILATISPNFLPKTLFHNESDMDETNGKPVVFLKKCPLDILREFCQTQVLNMVPSGRKLEIISIDESVALSESCSVFDLNACRTGFVNTQSKFE